jgi:hypothetical protein
VEGGIPIGILILLILAGLLLLTPGGRSLLWGRWGMVEPGARQLRSAASQTRDRQRDMRLGGPFRHGGGFSAFGRP